MKYYAMTDVGRRREMNQDYVYAMGQPIGPFPNLLVVADGMGGHKAGDFASKFTVEVVKREIAGSRSRKPEKVLRDAIQVANRELIRVASRDVKLEGMGTTLVVATVIGDTLYFANIGDSRLYLIDDNIKQLSKDHSLVEEMVRLGGIKPEEAKHHQDKNIITRAIGVLPEVSADFFETVLVPGDTVLLCSDGLTNMVDDDVIEKVLQKDELLNDQCQELIAKANENGGNDNITVLLADFSSKDGDMP